MVSFIRSHFASRICGVILELLVIAAGGVSRSASRDPVAPRRPFRAPLFNKKEDFYRARVLRRGRKVAAPAGRPERPAAMVSSEEAAALPARCDYLEWHAALAHHTAAQLHERLCELEAAMWRLAVSAASPNAQPVVPSVGPTAGLAPASETPT